MNHKLSAGLELVVDNCGILMQGKLRVAHLSLRFSLLT
jgi:hypothetical protein